ncbi:hypothetical protein V4D30_00615 [Thermodesulfovibrio sp. 3907-1M]|uniref:Vitamin K epoxide reductase domain-containing protein n=1 Tax=Thermodesulfovibrio autotrophicus TaxID=3118333 RepID=A0AAU8GZT9_9BACT
MFNTKAFGDSKFRFQSLTLVFYLIGFVVVLAETIFHIYGKSLCLAEGCRIVESFVKGGDLILLIAGLVLFGVLIFLSSYKFPEKIKPLIEYIHSGILIAALSVEGYLLGFQLFIIKELCIFCLTVFGILFISICLRLFKKRLEMVYAFAGFVCLILITYFVNPEINLIPSSRYVLVYSRGCPHCEEVIQFCKTHSISVQTIEAKEISGILRTLKIEHVPVLFCDEGTTKKFIVGQAEIKEYLLSQAPQTTTQEGVCPIFEKEKCQ